MLMTEVGHDLADLSGRFGDIECEDEMHLFCNENGFASVLPALTARRAQRAGGWGIVIGSGAITSLLPSLNLTTVAVIDKNSAVPRFTNWVAETITITPDPRSAKSKVLAYLERSASLNDQFEFDQDLELYTVHQFYTERASLGDYHWTSGKRFPVAQQSLRDTDLVPFNADISHPDLGSALSKIEQTRQQLLTYLNLSNVHQWVHSVDMLKTWPITQETVIQYASHRGQDANRFPSVRLASSLDEYFAQISPEIGLLADLH